MRDEQPDARYLEALRHFRAARLRADLERLGAKLTGRPADLLPFEEVRRRLRAHKTRRRVRKDIPLDAIVGSVGRYQDFTRRFLPRSDSDKVRWARVKVAADGLAGLPPIDVYQIGDAYFVLDGNHRVSVAREMGATHIEADVAEIETRVPVSPEDSPDDIILKAEYLEFLEYTDLDHLRPDHRLRVTAPGQYRKLMELIDIHHYYLSREAGHKIPYAEAVGDWYDNVYLPVVELIRERGILREFPGRTATDLFVWIAEHRTEISRTLGWVVDTETAARDLVGRLSPRPERVAERLAERLIETVRPRPFDSGPPPGEWRRDRLPTRRRRLFRDVLVGFTGDESGWNVLEQTACIARREEGRLHALHIVDALEDRYSDRVRALRDEFDARLARWGIDGELVVRVTSPQAYQVTRSLMERARWADLVAVSLARPPDNQPRARLSSGIANLLRRCPRPVLTVAGAPTPLQHALLAYDGSPKAQEALFVAAYLAGRWKIDLTIVSVVESGRVTDDTLGTAYEYTRKQGVQAECIRVEGRVVDCVLDTAAERHCDLLVLGGYGFTPVLEVVLGSAVDEILRTTRLPVLICR